jgi:hypothetical protein
MRVFLIAALMAVTASGIPAHAADVAVSVSIGQPGFYGRLDFGDYSPPQLIYQQPRMVRAVPAGRPPVYLNVPPGHSKNWSRYCRQYNACDERVYFVRNTWYEREYVPSYQRRHGDRRDDPRNDRRDDRRDDRQNDHRNNDGNRGGNR